ncbi:MAG: RDD family protein [Colwellia sp.]|nr:RDD family protein [Colwellia sp.]
MENTSNAPFPRAGFRRRFGSWIYDLLIIIAIFMLSGYVCVTLFVALDSFGIISIIRSGFGIDWSATHPAYKIAFNAWCILWVCGFFIYFWSKKGQTLGMKAWRLRVQNLDGSLMSKVTAAKRLLPTLLGLGSLAVIFDRKNKLSLQDRLTNTEVVVLSLEANRGRL